jgi:hypothetical protein
LKALLYDFYGLVPSEPVELLRYLISKLTSESLLIKNDDLINKIKQSDSKRLGVLLQDAPDDLASIKRHAFSRCTQRVSFLNHSPDYCSNQRTLITAGGLLFAQDGDDFLLVLVSHYAVASNTGRKVCPNSLKAYSTVMATLVTKLSFVTSVAISGVWFTSH